jgi:aryl-alcohol dehydrogenase-like predicted oxidoreductase
MKKDKGATIMQSTNPPVAASGRFTIGGDLTVYRLGFGTMRLTGPGIWGPPKNRDEAIAVLRRAVELGVNLLDTADSYGPEVAESLIAEALYPYPPQLVIATKGGYLRPGPDQWKPDGRPEHLRAALEGSLRRLRLQRIDVYQMHVPDPNVPYEVSIRALADMRAEGKIRHIGVSNVNREQLEIARSIVPIVTVQNRYNLVDRSSEEMVDICEREGLGFIPWFPLATGDLARSGGKLEQIATRHHATPAQIALAWLLQRSRTMLPIPGTSSVRHFEEDVAAAQIKLSDDEFRALDKGVS